MCVFACQCERDRVPGNELIGHMSAQMSSLFNKAGDLNCHYCQHLTVVLPARWYLVIYHCDELSQITLYYTMNLSQIRKRPGGFIQVNLKYIFIFLFIFPIRFIL